jgi:hypothetical protein
MLNSSAIGTIAPATDQPTGLPADMKIENPFDVFETITATGTGQGLCGDITVVSFANIVAPAALTKGFTACSEGYTTANSLLDILVGGCTVIGQKAITPTQPDVAGTSATIIKLTPGANKHVMVPDADGNAYSSFFTFAANRAHFTGQSCTQGSDCQTGQTCTTGICTPP